MDTTLFLDSVIEKADQFIQSGKVVVEEVTDDIVRGTINQVKVEISLAEVENGRYASREDEEAVNAAAIYCMLSIQLFASAMNNTINEMPIQKVRQILSAIIKDHSKYQNTYGITNDLSNEQAKTILTSIFQENPSLAVDYMLDQDELELKRIVTQLIDLYENEEYEVCAKMLIDFIEDVLANEALEDEVVDQYLDIGVSYLCDIYDETDLCDEIIESFVEERKEMFSDFVDLTQIIDLYDLDEAIQLVDDLLVKMKETTDDKQAMQYASQILPLLGGIDEESVIQEFKASILSKVNEGSQEAFQFVEENKDFFEVN